MFSFFVLISIFVVFCFYISVFTFLWWMNHTYAGTFGFSVCYILRYFKGIQILRKQVLWNFLTHPPTLCVLLLSKHKWPIYEPTHPV